MADMGKAFPTTNGVWSATTQYERLCIVTYNGSSYISTKDTINDVPGQSSNWQLIASKGDIGKTGDDGKNADLNYLSGDAIPINKFIPFLVDTDLNADGSGRAPGTSGNDKGWGYVYVVRNTFTNKFDSVIHDFDGKSSDSIKFYCFKSLSSSTATNTIIKNIGVDGNHFNLDSVVTNSDIDAVVVSVSNGTGGHVALYSSFVDSNNYYEPYAAGNNDLTSQNLYSPLTGSVHVMKRDHIWYINGNLGSWKATNDAQSVTYLPFSTPLMTFTALTDNSQPVTLAIFGSTLKLLNTSGKSGAIRFCWSIPEAML